MSKLRLRILCVGAAAFASVGPAFADRVDGEWCLEGKHFSINGPQIVTPGGATLQGDYTRHAFRYVTPPPDVDAGVPVIIQLMNETTLRLHMGEDAALPWQIWRRCEATS